MSKFVGFLRRNIVLVLSLPVLGVVHIAWWKLQHNPDFVQEGERRLPNFAALGKLAGSKDKEDKASSD